MNSRNDLALENGAIVPHAGNNHSVFDLICMDENEIRAGRNYDFHYRAQYNGVFEFGDGNFSEYNEYFEEGMDTEQVHLLGEYCRSSNGCPCWVLN